MLIRAAMAGVCYEPSALVRHEHRATFGDLRRQYRSWGTSWGAVLHKWYRTRAQIGRRSVGWPSVRSGTTSTTWWCRLAVGRYRSGHAALLLLGFAMGVTVAYPRSQRRMERRRRAVAAEPPATRVSTSPPEDRTAWSAIVKQPGRCVAPSHAPLRANAPASPG